MPTVDFYAQGALDIARPPKEVLIERVNAINATQYHPDQFELAPVVVEAGTNYNTSIWVMPVASSQWSTGFKVYYSRVRLQDAMMHLAEVNTAGSANLYSILEAVNAGYGIYLTEADVLDASVTYTDPQNPAGAGTVVITARNTSVFFTGTITIPVNNTVAHGISTYSDELLHFAALRSNGTDTIIAFNELGEQSQNYQFMRGTTIVTSMIKTMWKRPDGTLLITGAFTYTTTNEFNEVVSHNDKILALDRFGAITSASAGNLYGVNYIGLEYIPDFANDRVYVIDALTSIGGNTHGLHLYHENGSYLNFYQPSLAGKVVGVAPHLNKAYVITQVGTANPMIQRLELNGDVDPLFTPVELPFPSGRAGIDVCRVAAVSANDQGIAVALYAETVNGEIPWSEYSANQNPTGIAVPVLFIDHNGLKINAVGAPSPLLTSNRVGVATGSSLVAVGAQALFYSANAINPTSGLHSQNLLTVKMDGTVPATSTQAVSDLYPAYLNVASIYPLTLADMVVGANVQVLDGLGLHSAAGIFIYSYDGHFATQEVVIPDTELLSCASHYFLAQA